MVRPLLDSVLTDEHAVVNTEALTDTTKFSRVVRPGPRLLATPGNILIRNQSQEQSRLTSVPPMRPF